MLTERRRGWLLLLMAYLLVWVPLNFAADLAGVLPSLGVRGVPAWIEIAVHGAIAALAFGAGWAIWSGNEDALGLGSLAVACATIATIQSLFWSSLPGQLKPGDKVPLALLSAAHGSAWLWYLRRRARAFR